MNTNIKKRTTNVVECKCYRVEAFYASHDSALGIYRLPASMCFPKQLVDYAIYLDCLFVTCDKYGCRQFFNPNFEVV